MTQTGTQLDVNIENHGSLILFRLNTQAARDFVEANTDEDVQFFGGALVVEPRYADNLIEGMQAEGLEVR